MGLLNDSSLDFTEEDELILAGKINAERFAHLISLILDEKITSRQAKDILKIMFETGRDPEEILKTEGLETISDENQLMDIIKNVIIENEPAVLDYKNGKESALQFLVGKTMAKLKGRGNPQKILEIIKELIKK
jgi:aspartyl-tRNA(Asn)/glutamyl-tRNA(Gln) amidotransferase subunit B